MASEQPEQLKPGYWYRDNDCDSYIQAAIETELEGYKADKKYLLQQIFPDNGKNWNVLITPAVNGQTGVPAHEAQIDYFLDYAKQPDTTETVLRTIINDSTFNLVHEGTIEGKLKEVIETLNLSADANLQEVRKILKDSSYDKGNVENTLEERKKTLRLLKENSRIDVFDEIEDIWEDGKEQNFKILFPCNLGKYPDEHQLAKEGVGGQHWVLGEIQITKNKIGDCYVKIFEHDPFINEQMSKENYDKIYMAISKRLRELQPKIILAFERPDSPYGRRQTGGSECGVIVCDDLVKRIKGETLNIDSPHPARAPKLREKQINTIRKAQNIKEDSKKSSKIIASDKSSSKLTGKNPRWEKFSDDIKIKELVEKVFKSDTETVKIERKGKATIICEDNQDEIKFEKTDKSYELATKSQDEKTLTLMVEKTKALLEELNLKPVIEIEAPDEKTKSLLVKLCKAKGLQVKESPQQQQPEKKIQEDTSKSFAR